MRLYDLDANPDDLDPNVGDADIVIDCDEFDGYRKFLIPYLENKEFKIERVHRYASDEHVCVDFMISWSY